MSYVLCRSMKVQKADGSYEMRQPGQLVPEAAGWPNLGQWIRRGHITPVDSKVMPTRQGIRKPMRAVTAQDLEDWGDKKVVREHGEQPSDEGFDTFAAPVVEAAVPPRSSSRPPIPEQSADGRFVSKSAEVPVSKQTKRRAMEADLEELDRDSLYTLAIQNGLDIRKNAVKEKIIQVLLDHQAKHG
jgi:hypothetical protein